MAWRRALTQIGGPNALTVWTWLVTLPVSVLVSSVYAQPPTVGQIVTWTSALFLVHVCVGLLMLIAHRTLLPSRPRPSRPITALLVFASLGLVRAGLLQVAQERLGLGAFDLGDRLAFNVVAVILLFAAIAIVVDDYRAVAEITVRLETARATLAALREADTQELVQADRRILHEVEARLLADLRADDVDSRRLREISETVVRRTSHELAEPIGYQVRPSSTAPANRIGTLKRTIERMRVPSPLAVMLIVEIVGFTPIANRYGVAIAVANVFLGAAATFCGLWAMRRYVHLPSRAVPRLTVLAVGLAGISTAGTVVNVWIGRTLFGEFTLSPLAVAAGVTGLGLVLSAWVAAEEGRVQRQQDLSEAVTLEAQEVARLQSLLNERRLAAARFLHGTVQNELVAASLRGDSSDQLEARMTELFASYDAAESGRDPREDLRGLLASWGAVLDITATIDERCWSVLAGDQQRGSLLLATVSEGMTNAVRHSTGARVTLDISTDGDTVRVIMSTPGASGGQGTAGMGLHDLTARGAVIEMSTTGVATTMSARL